MTTLSASFDPTALNQYTRLPGQVYDADAMCKHILGSGSSFCQVILGTRSYFNALLISMSHLINSNNSQRYTAIYHSLFIT